MLRARKVVLLGIVAAVLLVSACSLRTSVKSPPIIVEFAVVGHAENDVTLYRAKHSKNGDVIELELVNSFPNTVDGIEIHNPARVVSGPDGKWYVGDFNNKRILRYDKDGSNPVVYATGVGKPYGLTFQGMTLYVSDYEDKRVYRITPDSESLPLSPEVFIEGAELFNEPSELVWGPDGYLYVAHADGVLRFDEEGKFIDEFVSADDDHKIAFDLAFDADGGLWVSWWLTGNIVRYDDKGNATTTVKNSSFFTYPCGIAFNPRTNRLWFIDGFNGVIEWNRYGEGDAAFTRIISRASLNDIDFVIAD